MKQRMSKRRLVAQVARLERQQQILMEMSAKLTGELLALRDRLKNTERVLRNDRREDWGDPALDPHHGYSSDIAEFGGTDGS